MSTELDKVRQSVAGALVKNEGGSMADPRSMASPWSPPKGFFTFRYSSTEIYSEGGNLHVKLREARYEDGRLKSEECEGTIDRQAYSQMMTQAQGYFLNQVLNFTRLLFAPFSGGRRHDE
jgi:hypothetical protein